VPTLMQPLSPTQGMKDRAQQHILQQHSRQVSCEFSCKRIREKAPSKLEVHLRCWSRDYSGVVQSSEHEGVADSPCRASANAQAVSPEDTIAAQSRAVSPARRAEPLWPWCGLTARVRRDNSSTKELRVTTSHGTY
jgi:hypothetical protein